MKSEPIREKSDCLYREILDISSRTIHFQEESEVEASKLCRVIIQAFEKSSGHKKRDTQGLPLKNGNLDGPQTNTRTQKNSTPSRNQGRILKNRGGSLKKLVPTQILPD